LGVADSNTSLSTIKFNGYLDDLAIWNVPLTPEQIRYQYQQGQLGFGATVPEPSSWLLVTIAAACFALVRRRRRG
jgi:hypothetical protein